MDAKGGNNAVYFPALRGYVLLTVNVISDIKSIPFLLIEREGNASTSKCVCAVNNPHGIYNDPGKKASIHLSLS